MRSFSVGAQWSGNDWIDQLPLVADEPRLLAVERWVKSHLEFGWEIVEREAYPPRVWITYPAHRCGSLSRLGIDLDQVIWIDVQGEVQVERVERE